MALASLAAVLLLYGVMEENHSTRVNIAKHAQVENVRIDPDRLPVAMVQYPATVTGQTSDGQSVRCTIRSLHDVESLSCVITSSRTPVPQPQVRVQASGNAARPTQAAGPATHDQGNVRVPRKPPVRAVRPATPRPAEDGPLTRQPPVTVPPVDRPVPAGDDTSGRGGDTSGRGGDTSGRGGDDVARQRDGRDGRDGQGKTSSDEFLDGRRAPVDLRVASTTCDERREGAMGTRCRL